MTDSYDRVSKTPRQLVRRDELLCRMLPARR